MSEPPKRQPSRLWADDRKRQILRVAARLLEERGVDGLRIPDVAAAAGVTRPVIYRHFPNRQAILMDLLESAGDAFVARLEGAVPLPRRLIRMTNHKDISVHQGVVEGGTFCRFMGGINQRSVE